MMDLYSKAEELNLTITAANGEISIRDNETFVTMQMATGNLMVEVVDMMNAMVSLRHRDRTSSHAHKMDLSFKVTVDTDEIERICVGGRLYDLLTYKHQNEKINFESGIEYKDGTVFIDEEKLITLMKMANKHSNVEHIEMKRRI